MTRFGRSLICLPSQIRESVACMVGRTERIGGLRVTARQLRKALYLSLLAIAIFAVSIMAGHLGSLLWRNLCLYESPCAFQLDLPEVPVPQDPPGRLVVCVVDGLRLDAAGKMETLQRLRESGAYFVLRAQPPTHTLSGWATILTGTTPYLHGLVTERGKGLELDNLPACCLRAGLPCAVFGSDLISGLVAGSTGKGCGESLPPPVGNPGYKEESDLLKQAHEAEERIMTQALMHLSRTEEGVVFIELPSLKLVGESFRAVPKRGSILDPYGEAAQQVDSRLKRLLLNLDLREDILCVVSSHGQADSGGHGGTEPDVVQVPCVVSGPGVPTGFTGTGELRDLAPTLCALAGLPYPAHMTGAPLLGALDCGGEEADRIVRSAVQVQHQFYRVYLSSLGAEHTVEPPAAQATRAALCPIMEDYREAARRASETGLRRERLFRAALSLPALALLVGGWCYFLLSRSPWRKSALYGTITFLAVAYGMYWITGHRYSWSSLRSWELVSWWFKGRQVEALLGSLGAGLMAGFAVARRGLARLEMLTEAVFHTVLTIVVALAAQFLLYYAAFGLEAGSTLAHSGWWVKAQVDLIYARLLGPWLPLTLLASWVAARASLAWQPD